MPSLTTSIVIPTYRRPHDLAACLDSILEQSAAPLEIIVVDNDAMQSAQAVVGQYEAKCRARRVALHYQPSPRNSLPQARNLGTRVSQGDIVLFLDDDVILENNYLDELLKAYEEKPAALGVQGYVINTDKRPRFWRRIFFLGNVESGVSRVLPSIRAIYPLDPDTLVPCEWFSGCSSSYRRSVLIEFPADENLIRYSFGEDLDQSYRIFTRFPDSLWLTPFARAIHKVSPVGRATGREPIYTAEVYGLYLFYKLFPPTFGNRMIYWWSAVGRMVGRIKRLWHGEFAAFGHHLGAFLFCWRHWREIKTGRLEFFEHAFGSGKGSL
jgi:GT2 family glycosyltransferase